MTTKELQQMAQQTADHECHATLDKEFKEGYVVGYQDGARKMIELVFAALDAHPIYTHYDMEDALKPFKQLLP